MLQLSFSSQSEYSAPSSVCPLGSRVCCLYTSTVGWLYLLQSVAQFPSGKAGVFSDWRWRPAGDVFCFEKVCFLLWGSAFLLPWVECRGIAVQGLLCTCKAQWQAMPELHHPLLTLCMFCGTREWPPCFSAVLWISCGPHPVSSAIQISCILLLPFLLLPMHPFPLQLSLFFLLLASPLLS